MDIVDQAHGDGWAAYCGDAVEVLRDLPAGLADLTLFSPPFSSVYTYSPSERDLGNVRSDAEFWEHFGFITTELRRLAKPGRHIAVHCQNLPTYESQDGVAGLRDFRGDVIRHFQQHGFIYHAEICIQKNPQTQAIRHHPRGLLFVQLERDASWMRQALADYVVVLRAPGDNPVSIHSELTHEQWISWAHPVWTDIRETDVLPTLAAKDVDDERHLCPLQLPVVDRCVRLWSNPGETVLSPFMGIGSEGVGALRAGRRFVGVELKRSYWEVAVRNLAAEQMQGQLDLFAEAVS